MNNTTNEKPSEPKISIESVRAMLSEVIDTKLAEQDTRLIDAFRKERAKQYEKIRNIFAWIASQFK